MTWKEEYQRAAGQFVLKHGSPRAMRDDYYLAYGWLADDWKAFAEHLDTHAPEEITTSAFTDVEWSEFENTFTDNSEHHGVETTVTCSCGRITDRVVRYEGSLGDILTGILTED